MKDQHKYTNNHALVLYCLLTNRRISPTLSTVTVIDIFNDFIAINLIKLELQRQDTIKVKLVNREEAEAKYYQICHSLCIEPRQLISFSEEISIVGRTIKRATL